MNKMNENGRSMIEMLGVLAIIGVLSVGGFSLINKMQTSYTTNQVIDTAGDFANHITKMVREYELDNPGAEHQASMNEYLCKAKAVPDSLLEGGAACSDYNDRDHPFYGINDVTYNVFYLTNGKASVNLQIGNVTDEMCMQLVTTNWGTPGTSGFIGLSVGDLNGEVVNNNSDRDDVAIVGNKDHPAPMGVGAAAKACDFSVSDGRERYVNLSFK